METPRGAFNNRQIQNIVIVMLHNLLVLTQ